jgi:hypothetical protein
MASEAADTLLSLVTGCCPCAHRYRITIFGRLGVAGQEAFAGFDIPPDGLATVLAGELDQAALHGALHRIQALGLELVGVARLG